MRTTSGWNLGAHGTDEFGLSMVPSGWMAIFDGQDTPSFRNSSIEFTFWVSKEAISAGAYRWLIEIHRTDTAFYSQARVKRNGYSVRCLANQ